MVAGENDMKTGQLDAAYRSLRRSYDIAVLEGNSLDVHVFVFASLRPVLD